MKLLIKEYLASLRERDELDAVLPDLLSELGFHILSRPAVGTRQYGVDFAAVGLKESGQRCVYLFSIKGGDLTRATWNGSQQALRPSLEEILDVYLGSRIPKQYEELPVVIVLCCGGEIVQNVEAEVHGFIKKASSKNEDVSFEVWTGDYLAELVLSGALGPELMPEQLRSLFRKSVSLLDEPDAAVEYYLRFVLTLIAETGPKQKDRIRTARQINLCQWILFVWARSIGNLEAAYRCSELSILNLWPFAVSLLDGKTAQAKAMHRAIDGLVNLYLMVSRAYVEKILPHAENQHGLSSAVRSSEPIDVTRRLFDALGRLALCGIWFAHLERMGNGTEDTREFGKAVENGLIHLINNNPTVRLPLEDRHSTDIDLACFFLYSRRRVDAIGSWVNEVARACAIATSQNDRYPCCLREYDELLEHPQRHDGYREHATRASILYPTLAFWAWRSNDSESLHLLSDMIEHRYAHTTFQLWLPGPDSEPSWYVDEGPHGYALTDIVIDSSGTALVNRVAEELAQAMPLESMSVMRFNLWPLLLVACRHYRHPVSPQFWPLESVRSEDRKEPVSGNDNDTN